MYELEQVMQSYGAKNLRLFGSVARGDATDQSDIDLMVDLEPNGGIDVMRVSGLSEEFSHILSHSVDVVTQSLLREGVSDSAMRDVIPVWQNWSKNESQIFSRLLPSVRNIEYF